MLAVGPGGAGRILQSDVLSALTAVGPMASPEKMTAWLKAANAPTEIKKELQEYEERGGTYQFQEDDQKYWLDEFICDLFGLLLFGPGFIAAHKALLQPAHPNPYKIDLEYPTHPPYAARQKFLTQALRILKWDQPISGQKYKSLLHAERAFLSYIKNDPYAPWGWIFSDFQVRKAIVGIKVVLSKYGQLAYKHPSSETLSALVRRLTERVPPILAEIDAAGNPKVSKTDISHILYSGWVFWIGRNHFVNGNEDALHFFDTNRLCERALLQQQAINMSLNPKRKDR